MRSPRAGPSEPLVHGGDLQLIAWAALALAACARDRAEPSAQSELERRLERRLAAKGIRAAVRCPWIAGRGACTGVQRVDGGDKPFAIDVELGAAEAGKPALLAWSIPPRYAVVDLRKLAGDLAAQRRSLIPPACDLDVVVLAPEDEIGCTVLDEGVFRRLLITPHADRSHPFSWRWAR
ncbi:MAG: hypothetical protein KF773_11445 [Deltaproteobacteria bacterium]|nr:hypothetical protein [Deltaproteobacteria bacterium]